MIVFILSFIILFGYKKKNATARTFNSLQDLWAGTRVTANPPTRSGRSDLNRDILAETGSLSDFDKSLGDDAKRLSPFLPDFAKICSRPAQYQIMRRWHKKRIL